MPWLREVVLDFLEVHGLREAVDAVRRGGRSAVVATPRVLKPEEEKLWRFYLSLGADALLVRSAGLMRTLATLRREQRRSERRETSAPPSEEAPLSASRALAGASASSGISSSPDFPRVPPLRGDFSLNAANAIGAAALLRRGGLERLTPTHDLDARQQANLARALGPAGAARLEVVAHQHLPIFHTEHCVFCRFLSDGNSYKDCGHPCETSSVHLRDGSGADHLLSLGHGLSEHGVQRAGAERRGVPGRIPERRGVQVQGRARGRARGGSRPAPGDGVRE